MKKDTWYPLWTSMHVCTHEHSHAGKHIQTCTGKPHTQAYTYIKIIARLAALTFLQRRKIRTPE